MRRLLIVISICLCWSYSARAQAAEAQQLLLNWEKLNQLKEILDNMYRGYKILDKGYRTIRDLAEGNFTIHDVFIQGLMAVNPAVRNYSRIPYIIEYQKFLLSEYKRAFNRFKQDPNFTPGELEYLASVYEHLFNASLKNIDELLMIITASKLSMSDDERLEAIDRIFFDMEDKLTFLRSFNNSTSMLAIQRAKSRNDVQTMEKLYGIY